MKFVHDHPWMVVKILGRFGWKKIAWAFVTLLKIPKISKNLKIKKKVRTKVLPKYH